MSKWSRNKGHSFERKIANEFKKFFPESKRHLEYQMSEANGVDVKAGPFVIQTKKLKGYAPVNRIEEVKACPIENEIPVLVTAGDFKRPIACLYLDDFLEMVEGLYGRKTKKASGA